jgi:hypothetical protein
LCNVKSMWGFIFTSCAIYVLPTEEEEMTEKLQRNHPEPTLCR